MELFSKNVFTTKTYDIRAYFRNIHKYITTTENKEAKKVTWYWKKILT